MFGAFWYFLRLWSKYGIILVRLFRKQIRLVEVMVPAISAILIRHYRFGGRVVLMPVANPDRRSTYASGLRNDVVVMVVRLMSSP